MMIKKIFLSLILLLSVTNSYSQIDILRSKIEDIIRNKQAKVGVSISSLDLKDTLSINGDEHFVLQSVYKFHLALAVLSQVDNGKLALKQLIFFITIRLRNKNVESFKGKTSGRQCDLTT